MRIARANTTRSVLPLLLATAIGPALPGWMASGSASAQPPAMPPHSAPKPGATPASKPTPKPVEQPKTERELQVEQYGKLGYRLQWIGYASVMRGASVRHARVLDDLIAVQDTMGALSAIQTRDGVSRWSQLVADETTNFLDVIRAGPRIVACGESELYLIDADSGNPVGKQHLARVVNTPPAQLGSLLVFGTASGSVLAHNLNRNLQAWAYMIDGPVYAAPATMGDDAVGVVSARGQVLILDAMAGVQLGRAAMFANAGSDPAADSGMLYVASLDQSLYAFRRAGGFTAWRIRTEQPLRGKPVLSGDRLILTMPDGFQALDAATGQVKWTNADLKGELVAVRGDRGIVWGNQTITTIDMATGQTVEHIEFPDVAMIRTSKFVDGDLYLITRAGAVTKLSPR